MAFPITLSFQGKTVSIDVTMESNGLDIYERALEQFNLQGGSIKLIYKGKRLESQSTPVFAAVPKKLPKILVMATSSQEMSEIQSKRSDPTIRGFDQERTFAKNKEGPKPWGYLSQQDKDYKFCRFQSCTWQSFGHRPNSKTPHAFAAMKLLEKLATDPGIVAIMKERELVVGTLGEMDPIDDRLMQKQEQHGGCLLGYNTNGGMRIDLKLRTDNLEGFRPYPALVSTLIHELSHNWIGDHSILFWTNYAQMKAEYLHTHARLRSSLIAGKTSAFLAGLEQLETSEVFDILMKELDREMAQHSLHPNMIAAPIAERCRELDAADSGHALGGGDSAKGARSGDSARERALAAAERRARDAKKDEAK